MKRAIFILSLSVGLLLQVTPTTPCTIFKMTASGRALVGNNEDWLDAEDWAKRHTESNFRLSFESAAHYF